MVAAVLMITLIGGTVLATSVLADARTGGNWASIDVATREETTPMPTADPQWRIDPAARVEVDTEGFLAWAALDRTTGTRISSPNATDTSSTESMIKSWIVADHLRRAGEQATAPGEEELQDARLAIRQSNNSAAQRLYVSGGQDAVVERMIETCGLADTYIPQHGSGWWSRTEMSPADAVRLGECLLDGTAAGPEWTHWLLAEMRQVVGTTADEDQRPEEDFEGGHWGIIDGLPDGVDRDEVSIKNGWTRIGSDSSWHVNCLAVTEQWVIAVMMRYPANYPLDYGARQCASVARQLFTDRAP
jgi:hypothetical protein